MEENNQVIVKPGLIKEAVAKHVNEKRMREAMHANSKTMGDDQVYDDSILPPDGEKKKKPYNPNQALKRYHGLQEEGQGVPTEEQQKKIDKIRERLEDRLGSEEAVVEAYESWKAKRGGEIVRGVNDIREENTNTILNAISNKKDLGGWSGALNDYTEALMDGDGDKAKNIEDRLTAMLGEKGFAEVVLAYHYSDAVIDRSMDVMEKEMERAADNARMDEFVRISRMLPEDRKEGDLERMHELEGQLKLEMGREAFYKGVEEASKRESERAKELRQEEEKNQQVEVMWAEHEKEEEIPAVTEEEKLMAPDATGEGRAMVDVPKRKGEGPLPAEEPPAREGEGTLPAEETPAAVAEVSNEGAGELPPAAPVVTENEQPNKKKGFFDRLKGMVQKGMDGLRNLGDKFRNASEQSKERTMAAVDKLNNRVQEATEGAKQKLEERRQKAEQSARESHALYGRRSWESDEFRLYGRHTWQEWNEMAAREVSRQVGEPLMAQIEVLQLQMAKVQETLDKMGKRGKELEEGNGAKRRLVGNLQGSAVAA